MLRVVTWSIEQIAYLVWLDKCADDTTDELRMLANVIHFQWIFRVHISTHTIKHVFWLFAYKGAVVPEENAVEGEPEEDFEDVADWVEGQEEIEEEAPEVYVFENLDLPGESEQSGDEPVQISQVSVQGEISAGVRRFFVSVVPVQSKKLRWL